MATKVLISPIPEAWKQLILRKSRTALFRQVQESGNKN
jgi:hypothetical protein